LGAKIDAIQKQTAPPVIRKVASESPEIPFSKAVLPIGDINPHIMAAPSNAKCPLYF
jgi:hypothetical protein